MKQVRQGPLARMQEANGVHPCMMMLVRPHIILAPPLMLGKVTAATNIRF